jgi:muconolactone delta-isomerase
MNIIVNTTLGKVENIQELLPNEYAYVATLQEEGVLEHLFVKESAGGAMIVFKNLNLEEVKSRVAGFPLFPHFEQIEYTIAEKKF